MKVSFQYNCPVCSAHIRTRSQHFAHWWNTIANDVSNPKNPMRHLIFHYENNVGVIPRVAMNRHAVSGLRKR